MGWEDEMKWEKLDKLTIALLAILYAGTGDSAIPALIWYAIAGLNVMVFIIHLAEWVSNKIEVRLR